MRARDEPREALASAEAAALVACCPKREFRLEDLKGAIGQCDTFKRTGIVLAWWLINASGQTCCDGITLEFMNVWRSATAKHRWTSKRMRGATFPLRLGEFSEFEEVFASSTLSKVLDDELVDIWSDKAWAYLSGCALNRLAGFNARPLNGRWTKSEQAAASSLLSAARRRCSSDVPQIKPSEEAWQKDMSSKKVGYNGEEVSVCQQLTLEQVLPALPPEEHGGCIDCLNWVGPRTKEFLCNPDRLIKKSEDILLPGCLEEFMSRKGTK